MGPLSLESKVESQVTVCPRLFEHLKGTKCGGGLSLSASRYPHWYFLVFAKGIMPGNDKCAQQPSR